MILRELRIEGFGTLANRRICFDPRFTIVHGPNEAGKSTLTAALLATLYGLGRGEKERYRPWSGARFATALTYALEDGRTFEVQREFERDGKGIRVYDAHGNDASPECTIARTVCPGHAHLGIPLEVFVNASFLAQGDAGIDGTRAERITHALARALDGGPKDDAALGALQRLDLALATHVGTKRATVNAPLRQLHDELAANEARADDMRARLRALEALRLRLEDESARSRELEAALREHERRGRGLRAYTLQSRLDALAEVRRELAVLQAARARYDDAANVPAERIAGCETAYGKWHTADALARSHAGDVARAERAAPDHEAAIGDAAFAELEAAAAAARVARERARSSAADARDARGAHDRSRRPLGGAVAATIFVAFAAAALALAKDSTLAEIVATLAVALGVVAGLRWNARRTSGTKARDAQRAADDASERERTSAQRLAALLATLAVGSLEEAALRRARGAERTRLAATLAQTQHDVRAAAATFDASLAPFVAPSGDRARDLAVAKDRAARKIARDGIELRLSMLDVRRSDVLGADDENALESERAELAAACVEPIVDRTSPRAFEAERAALARRASESRSAVAATAAELRTAETHVGDLAACDERSQTLRARAERLADFEAAVTLARETIDERTREAHQKFAGRLTDYATRGFARVTGERYLDVRVDPVTLAVRVRVPETGEIVDVDRLSAGTREQAYLAVRLAMARMFSEGLEPAPLLLDDPFAFWDDARIERCLPLLAPDPAGDDPQVVVFTTSEPLVAAARARGAGAIDLGASLVASD